MQRAPRCVSDLPRTQPQPQPLPPVSTPEDIHQFPPSSLPAEKSSDGPAPARISNSKQRSSPTPLARRTERPTSAISDSDSEPLDLGAELDKAMERTSRKQHLDNIKRKAMEAKVLRPAVPDDSDDELSIGAPGPPKVAAPTKAPTAQSLISNRIATAAPNKQKQNLLRISGARAGGRRPVTETHLQFAGKDFDHANQKMANAGSRPAGQKPGRDNVISQLQMDAQMRASHQRQVRDLAIAKERQFGKGRQLPAKQAIDLAAVTKVSDELDEHDSASDEGDSDYDPVSGSDDEVNDDVASNASAVGDSAALATSTSGTPEPHTQPSRSRQVVFADAEDDDADSAAQPRHRPSRRLRRVAADSESEDDGGKELPAPGIATTTATAANLDTDAFDDFGDDFGEGGFSQLFETTQAFVGSEVRGPKLADHSGTTDHLAE